MEQTGLICVGQRFGKLLAESFISNRKVPFWLCRCDCGNTVNISEAALIKGYRKSCGCMKSPDITGQRYGLLTVLGRSDKRAPRGKRTVPLWECQCDCGAIVYKATDTLTNTALCSCRNCANMRNTQAMRNKTGFVEGTQLSRLIKADAVGTNNTGCRGVSFEKNSQRWRANIGFQGKKINLGSYKTLDEAIQARKLAEDVYYKPILDKYKWNEQKNGNADT